MVFDKFINSLKQELNVDKLETTKKGFKLDLDRSISIDIFPYKDRLFFLSPAPTVIESGYQAEQKILQMMSWALAWKNGNTQLVVQKDNTKLTAVNTLPSTKKKTKILISIIQKIMHSLLSIHFSCSLTYPSLMRMNHYEMH